MSLYTDPRFQAFMGQTWRPGGERLTRHGVELCAWPPGALVADVGCGPGGTTRLLREMGYRVLGFDRHTKADVRPSGNAGGIRKIAADASALPLASASLDGAVCECVLSLLPEPELAVRELSRVLRGKGRALVSDVTGPNLESRALVSDVTTDQVTAETTTLPKGSCSDGALDPESVRTWFSKAGLRVLHVEDHRAAMRELAAQLAWRGIPCGCGKPLGYHLWIVEKNGESNHA